jgi:hypothetical protein
MSKAKETGCYKYCGSFCDSLTGKLKNTTCREKLASIIYLAAIGLFLSYVTMETEKCFSGGSDNIKT